VVRIAGVALGWMAPTSRFGLVVRWAGSGIEFEAEQGMRKALIGLFDLKWEAADFDQDYLASVSEFVSAQGKVLQVRHEKQITYPRL
jgi:hypothetical protein